MIHIASQARWWRSMVSQRYQATITAGFKKTRLDVYHRFWVEVRSHENIPDRTNLKRNAWVANSILLSSIPPAGRAGQEPGWISFRGLRKKRFPFWHAEKDRAGQTRSRNREPLVLQTPSCPSSGSGRKQLTGRWTETVPIPHTRS